MYIIYFLPIFVCRGDEVFAGGEGEVDTWTSIKIQIWLVELAEIKRSTVCILLS